MEKLVVCRHSSGRSNRNRKGLADSYALVTEGDFFCKFAHRFPLQINLIT